MVQAQAAARFGLPLSLFTYDSAHHAIESGALPGLGHAAPLLAPNTLTFHYAQNGLDVVKTFSFDSSYVIHVDSEVRRNGQPVRALVHWPAGLGDMEEFLALVERRAAPSLHASRSSPGRLTASRTPTAAAKVSGNATRSSSLTSTRRSSISILRRRSCPMRPQTRDAGHAAPHHRPAQRSQRIPTARRSRPTCIGLAMGDHQRRHAPARSTPAPKQTDVLKVIHAIGADGKPDRPVARAR